jgi:hypothetical protein
MENHHAELLQTTLNLHHQYGGPGHQQPQQQLEQQQHLEQQLDSTDTLETYDSMEPYPYMPEQQ